MRQDVQELVERYRNSLFVAAVALEVGFAGSNGVCYTATVETSTLK